MLRWKVSIWQRQQRQQALIDQPSLRLAFTELQTVSAKLANLVLHPPDANQRDA